MAVPILDKNDISKLRSHIEQAQRIVITCHKSPDGDALGSSLALYSLFQAMGKLVNIITPDMPPRQLNDLPLISRITINSQNEVLAKAIVERADLIFCLDFNALYRIDRLGDTIDKATAVKVLIDHHMGPDIACDIMFSFPLMSSTCELVYYVIRDLGYMRLMNRTIAQCLYVGMMTDTGNFTFNSDYPEIYQVIAHLVSFNINKEWLYNLAMNTFSADCLRLRGYAINEKMQIYEQQHAAVISLNKDELTRYNYHKGDTEGLVNKPLSIPGITMSIFVREDNDNIKISCRSRGDRSVEEICRLHFGGGGHLNAAGGEYYGPMDDALALIDKIIKELKY